MYDLKNSKKFSLHLIDDNVVMVKSVQLALFINGACDDLLDFKYFQSVGEAIAHYTDNGGNNFPDIALVDIDFTDEDLDESEKGKLKGFELIKYLSKNAKNRTEIFAFTAFNNRKEVMAELYHLNLPGKLISKGSEIDAQVSIPIQMILQEMAKNVIKNLNREKRHQLTKLDDNFAEFKVSATERGRPKKNTKPDGKSENIYHLPCLLAGWGDVRNLKRAEVQEIVNKILIGETSETKLTGNWAESKSWERILYNQYTNLTIEDHDVKFKYIYQQAFELMIELMSIQDSPPTKIGEIFHLSARFTGFSVYKTLSENTPIRYFEDKLIGRLALLALDHKNADFKRDYSKKDEYASLLHSAVVNDDISDSTVDQVFYTHLGLSVDTQSKRFITEPEFLLPEEANFIKIFGSSVKAFARFLENCEIPDPLKINRNEHAKLNSMHETRELLHNYEIKAGRVNAKKHAKLLFVHETLKQLGEYKCKEVFKLFDIPI
jgi:hypothetical protein